jgi:predicted flap endonuclease-1-like 5' DNA nuclease
MWKYFFLGLLVGWLLEWVIDWVYWRRGIDPVATSPNAAGGVAEGPAPRTGSTAQAGARVAMSAEAAGANMSPVPRQPGEPGVGESTSAGTAAGRVAADVVRGTAGAVSTSSATLTSRAPVYRQEDLEAVVGVGPKIGAMLRNNGITTFAELVTTPVAELERIVESTGEEPAEVGVQTWAAQARLAASQDWEGLARLQDELQSDGAAARREA